MAAGGAGRRVVALIVGRTERELTDGTDYHELWSFVLLDGVEALIPHLLQTDLPPPMARQTPGTWTVAP